MLVNGAGIIEGGAIVDVPVDNMRRQFEVNIIGPLLLTQGFARKMIKRRSGKIIFMSSVVGILSGPFVGIYGASKHAIEGIADTMSMELQEFGVEVAVINPGPYLTGFNDAGFLTPKDWDDNPAERVFDYDKLAFPFDRGFSKAKPAHGAALVRLPLPLLLCGTEQNRNSHPAWSWCR